MAQANEALATTGQPIQTGDGTTNGNEGHPGNIPHNNNVGYGDRHFTPTRTLKAAQEDSSIDDTNANYARESPNPSNHQEGNELNKREAHLHQSM